MTVRRILWAATLSVVLGLAGAGSAAENDIWHAVTPPATGTASATPEAAPERSEPAATLGRPVPLSASSSTEAPSPFPRARDSGCPGVIVRAQAPDPPPPSGGPPPVPPPVPPPGDPYNPAAVIDRPLNHSFWDKCKEWVTPVDHCTSCSSRAAFESDHCFDFLASPVTNPFFFEDPRSLTELRPIFIYQKAPSGNPIFHGGHSDFFDTQARLAFTEHLSFVISELGFVSLHPGSSTDTVRADDGRTWASRAATW
jgi:hypothetical protein